MLNRLARYQPVVRCINDNKPSSILEIGSGSLGIGEFCPRPFTGVDIAFEGAPIAHMTPVKASATELPFPDNAFDLVICLDMLEHVGPEKRKRVIDEALRVTRNICIIGFPWGVAAHESDERLHQWCNKKGVPVPTWLEEHMQVSFPDENVVTSRINGRHDLSCSEFGNEYIGTHYYMGCLEMHPRRWIRNIASFLRYRLESLSGAILSLMNLPPYYRRMYIIRKEHGLS